MTRIAVLFPFVVYFLSAIPYGSAGPACAKKYWQQQSCVEQCKGKWGYPGLMMGSGPWGAVIQKTEENDWDSVIASACGMPVSSTASAPAASATIAGAIGNSPPSSSVSSAAVSTTEPISSSAISSSSSPVSTSPSISISNATFSVSLSSSIASSSDTSILLAPTTSSTEELSSTSQFTPPATTFSADSSAAEAPSPATTSTPAPAPPLTTSSTPAPAPTTSSVVAAVTSSSSSTSSGSNGSGASDSDVQEYLSAHNSVRAQHGASALTWSNDAATKAQQWADNCVFQHSGGTLGPFGENLAAGTGSGYGIAQAIDSWSSEVSQYDPSNPVASHFTQMVWKATTQVGCAVASCSGIFAASFGLASFYVCEYSPQGNVIGEFAQNVQA
ncbi:CAP domain-containing protein [Lentinula edodes]|uniref:CAP domain-containing protein n=1 Tax=Lentinula edodes TaxID=5353 RepID=UPI001E8CA309|nr:CAP domain-containing protein [Lentinula edodes]KAH7880528.1 CAP domain-containing protein [Lentinula edodes]